MSKNTPQILENQLSEAKGLVERPIRTTGSRLTAPLTVLTPNEQYIQPSSSQSNAGSFDTPSSCSRIEGLPATNYDVHFLLKLYTTMLRIRAFETAVALLFRRGRILGFAHLSIGQEAVPTGTCAALQENDYLTLTHRGHGQMIARGARLDRMMAELYGKVTGYCKGKGGSVHLADFQRGILGANGIVGAGIAIATGAALSAKMRGTKQIAVAFFGDGAVNQGAFHESLNMASMMKLPVLFVCENNQYAVTMAERKATAAASIAERGQAYLMPGVQVDGQNVLAVYEATKEAAERARRGDGPSLIECLTYRYHGHWEGERVDLRPAEEVRLWQQRDPIGLLGHAMTSSKIISEERLRAVQDEVCVEIAEAICFAEKSPYPSPAEAVKDVLLGNFMVE